MRSLQSVPCGERGPAEPAGPGPVVVVADPFDTASGIIDAITVALPEQYRAFGHDPAATSRAQLINGLEALRRAHRARRIVDGAPGMIDIYDARQQLYRNGPGRAEMTRIFSTIYRVCTCPTEPVESALTDIQAVTNHFATTDPDTYLIAHSDDEGSHELTARQHGVLYDPVSPPYSGREAQATVGLQLRLVTGGDIFINFLPADLMPKAGINAGPRRLVGPRVELLVGASATPPLRAV